MIVSFAFASLVLIALPGPDQALITRNALVGGRSAGIRTTLGGVTGSTVHAAAAVLGLSALLAASAAAYTALKLVGVAYLVYLGLKLLLSPRSDEVDKQGRGGHWFAQGFMSNALNPKVALFFLTFLPQFLPATGPTLPAAIGLSAIFAVILRCMVQRPRHTRRPREWRATPTARQSLDRARYRRRARRVRDPSDHGDKTLTRLDLDSEDAQSLEGVTSRGRHRRRDDGRLPWDPAPPRARDFHWNFGGNGDRPSTNPVGSA
jgi:threonine/homoserine/homoserine lactone efflux protein